MSPEERAILQGMVNSFYDQFVDVVAKARKDHLPAERVRQLADGRVYTGVEAKKLGLVDEVGYLEDALKCALDMACLKDAAVIAYDNSNCGYRGSIYAKGPSIPKEINLRVDVPGLNNLTGLAGYGGNGFWYVWEPGVKR